MLSKKMAFSLMSLIAIFALAFVVPTAMAAEFAVTLSVDAESDISSDGGIQIMNGSPATIHATFGAVVALGAKTGFDASDITAIAYNEFGGTETAPKVNAPSDYDSDNPDGMNFTIMVDAPGAGVTRVLLYMAKHGVEVADPRANLDAGVRTVDGKSAEASVEVKYVGADEGKPRVYSIRRVDSPALPITAETVQVVVRLSEKPAEFTKDHISVTEATAADPVALVPVPEDTLGFDALVASVATAAELVKPAALSLYDVETDDDASPPVVASTGLHTALKVEGAYPDLVAAYATYSATNSAEPATTSGTPVVDLTGLQTEDEDNAVFPIVAPSKTAGETGRDRTTKPVRPNPADFADPTLLGNAETLFNTLNLAYNGYQAQVVLHNAYLMAVAKVRMDEAEKTVKYNNDVIDALEAHFTGQTIPRENPLPATGRDNKLYPYVVTITPKYLNANDIVVTVKAFTDQAYPTPNRYIPPATDAAYRENINKLTIKVKEAQVPAKTDGIVVFIPEKTIIPKDGYLVVAKDAAGSAVRSPGDAAKSPVDTVRQPFGLTYNLVAGALPNLETQLINGATIDIVGAESLIISEIMWGTDASVAISVNSQYIEIRNTSGAEITAGLEEYELVFYAAGSVLPDASVAANNVQDRIGTVGASGYWSVADKGQSGRTGIGEAPGELTPVTPTQALISMQRVIDATDVAADGTMASSWAASAPPGLNFDQNIEGVRIGSPGRAPTEYPTAPVVEAPIVAPVVPVAESDDIVISEIMVDTGGGRLPQWIELTNVSGAAVSLAGWSIDISNDAADADVVGGSVSIDLSGTLGVGGGEDAGGTMGKSLLLVAGDARSSSNLVGNDRVVDVSDQVGETGRYTLISEMAFMVALVPPQKTGVLKYGDTAGNLNAAEAWEIPMAEGARSSLIRRETDGLDMATMGTAANGWIMASATSLVSGPATWYGSDEDAGTPGYDSGGPLPVELSMFYPARDKITGAAVIKWSTQSELNNAGFFIKRSQQRSTNFKVINAAMISGAGTTSEKQSYTYTDTTAQPNVVYYYQIEDVSLDGNRQLLTRGIRLRGHIGAGGKATVLWGDLKTSQ